jgi:hypothetical protein
MYLLCLTRQVGYSLSWLRFVMILLCPPAECRNIICKRVMITFRILVYASFVITTRTWTTVLEPLGAVISIRFARGYKRRAVCHVDAGSNTSTVALRVEGGDEKGSLESETVKYGHEYHGTRTRKWLRWQGLGAIVNDRPVPSLERARHINKPAEVW